MTKFEGSNGRRNLIQALLPQRLVEHKPSTAEFLADHGVVQAFNGGDTIIAQGAGDNDAFFILSGEADVFVNNRKVATRGTTESVGEMAVVDPAAPRAATVKARGAVLMLRVPAEALEQAADAAPLMWRALAHVLANRLAETERFQRPANAQPILFIGSSAEGLELAREVQEQLKHDRVVVRPWTTGVFGPGGVSADDLVKQADVADFALFVFGPDDQVASRDDVQRAPRDNVVFEMGLFMGRLGRSRTLIMKEHRTDLKIPTDLLGIGPITYVARPGTSIAEQLGPACNVLRKAMRELGAL